MVKSALDVAVFDDAKSPPFGSGPNLGCVPINGDNHMILSKNGAVDVKSISFFF